MSTFSGDFLGDQDFSWSAGNAPYYNNGVDSVTITLPAQYEVGHTVLVMDRLTVKDIEITLTNTITAQTKRVSRADQDRSIREDWDYMLVNQITVKNTKCTDPSILCLGIYTLGILVNPATLDCALSHFGAANVNNYPTQGPISVYDPNT